MTNGRFIHILHDDDWVENGFYRKMREAIESLSRRVGVAFCQYEMFYERSGRTWSPPPFRARAGLMDRNFLFRLATECPLNLPAVVFGRETFERIGLFRADLPMMADWECYVRSATQRNWLHLPETLAHWRTQHAGQLTEQLLEFVRGAARFSPNTRDLRPNAPAGVAAAVAARGADPEDATLSGRRGRMHEERPRRPRPEKRLGSLRARRSRGRPAGIRRTRPAPRLRVAAGGNSDRRTCDVGSAGRIGGGGEQARQAAQARLREGICLAGVLTAAVRILLTP